MRYKPHEYQQFTENFILTHPVAAIFLNCGLGKTVITLTAIEELIHDLFEIRNVLVVAPLRVARDTWPSEIEKWDHLKGLTFAVAVGSEKERLAALKKHADIHIINRENIPWLIEKSGLPFDYDMIVLDELSSFKNRQAKRFRALMKVRPTVKRIVGLTGTPSSNGLMDLWAEYRILDFGERLGRYISRYHLQYFRPDRYNGPVVYSYKPLPGAEEQIYNRISDITISMKSTDYLKMPEKILNEVRVKLDEKERKLYDTMKKDLTISLKDKEIDAGNAAALSGKLIQMADGAVYDNDGGVVKIHDRKLDALEDLIEAANGKPVLISYWYRHDLDRIKERFPLARELKSHEDFTAWNKGRIPVALIHPASAGHGLNLQSGGSTIIWFTLTWSLELYEQMNTRLWRQGQQSETVVIHHIITEGTIDENIMKALRTKDKTQSALIDAVKANLKGGTDGSV
jgi:SNF2 family DNA or RNA helicase